MEMLGRDQSEMFAYHSRLASLVGPVQPGTGLDWAGQISAGMLCHHSFKLAFRCLRKERGAAFGIYNPMDGR